MCAASTILAAVVLLAVVLVAALAPRAGGRDRFEPGETLTVTWAPPAYQFPKNLVYDWGVCAQGVDVDWDVACGQAGRDPNDPSTWSVSGAGVPVPSVTISQCGSGCGGYPLRFGVRARDPAASPPVTGPWAFAAIDLSGASKGTLAVLDPSGLPLVAGSTGVAVSLALAPGAPPGAAGHVTVFVLRGGTPVYTFMFAAPVPMASADGGVTWRFAGPLTAVTPAAPWREFIGDQGNPPAVPPGPLQKGDVVSVAARVATTGAGGKVAYWAETTLPAVGTGALAAPAGFGWALA